MAGESNPFSTALLRLAQPRLLPAIAREMIDSFAGTLPKMFDRRKIERRHFEAAGFINSRDRQVVEFYTYDLNAFTLGFVSTTPTAVGTRGNASVELPNGGRFEIGGRVVRCREFKADWFEGCISFSTTLRTGTVDLAA